MNHEVMKCRLFEFYDGELTPIERREVAAHLTQCSECRELYTGWRRTAKALFRATEPQGSEAFVRRVLNRLPAATPRRQVVPWIIRLPWLVPAFGLAALMLVVLKPAEHAVSVDTLLFADGWEQASTQLVLASETPSPEDVLGFVMEGSQ